MSIKATNAVWDHSQTVGTARCVLALIADSANDAGWHSFDKQETLARKANASLRTVERCIETAIALGELEVHRPDRSGRNQYSVMLPGLAIFEDPEERVLRDEHYSKLSLGRAAQTIVNREKRVANRRSEDPTSTSGPSSAGPDTSVGSHPTPASGPDPTSTSGPSSAGPDTSVGSHPTPASGPDPTSTSGAHPTPASGLKENNNLNTNETPVNEIALAAEGLWNLWPHKRRNLNAQRTLDVLRGLGADNVADIERITAAAREDIQSADFREGFVPNFSNWLRDRQWDRPLGDVVHLAAVAGVEFADADPELERIFRHDVSDDAWDSQIAKCWHGRRGDTYVLGHDRDVSWIQARYGRVLNRILQSLDYAGLELVTAEPPQITKENAA